MAVVSAALSSQRSSAAIAAALSRRRRRARRLRARRARRGSAPRRGGRPAGRAAPPSSASRTRRSTRAGCARSARGVGEQRRLLGDRIGRDHLLELGLGGLERALELAPRRRPAGVAARSGRRRRETRRRPPRARAEQSAARSRDRHELEPGAQLAASGAARARCSSRRAPWPPAIRAQRALELRDPISLTPSLPASAAAPVVALRRAARQRRRDLRGQERHGARRPDALEHHVVDARVPLLLIDAQRGEISASGEAGRLGRQAEAPAQLLEPGRGAERRVAERLGALRRVDHADRHRLAVQQAAVARAAPRSRGRACARS